MEGDWPSISHASVETSFAFTCFFLRKKIIFDYPGRQEVQINRFSWWHPTKRSRQPYPVRSILMAPLRRTESKSSVSQERSPLAAIRNRFEPFELGFVKAINLIRNISIFTGHYLSLSLSLIETKLLSPVNFFIRLS